MPTRREFLKQTSVAGMISSASGQLAYSAEKKEGSQSSSRLNKSPRIGSMIRREETTVHHGGSGDNWHMSWGADDRLFVTFCDGYGWFDKPKGLYNSRLLSIDGGPQNATFQDVPGYPELKPSYDKDTRYYSFGTLTLDRKIYQFTSTFNRTFPADTSKAFDLRFVGAKLIYSPDYGRAWHNQDGSTPVVWEQWQQRSRKNMVFFEEPQDAFSLLSILQMGRNYEANRDGYIYVYAPNGTTDGTMNELVMFRVRKTDILNRSAYEYFAGLQRGEKATWTKDIKLRAVVHIFPRGWVNKSYHPWSWMPSVAYNPPLGLYMMASWGTASSHTGKWFDKPSYLGFWVASNPWGPWRQIHEETAWMPEGDPGARAFAPQIAPKWIAEDGKSFWLVWSDFRQNEAECKRLREFSEPGSTTTDDEIMRRAMQFRRCLPMYSFHTQRVDLVIS